MFIVRFLIISPHEELSYLYSNGKKGKRASCRRDRERVCVRDGEWLKTELESVVKTAVGRRINYFEISREPNIRITFL